MRDLDSFFFWTGRKWPYSPPGYVFLCEAVLITGKHIYGDEWRGDEPCPPAPVGLGNRPITDMLTLAPGSDAKRDHRKAVQLLESAGHVVEYRDRKFGGTKVMTGDCWNRAIQMAAAHDAECAKRAGRFSNAANVILDGLRSGAIGYALRHVQGGAMGDPMPPHLWHAEKLSQRFRRGQMSSSDPFGPAISGDGFHYIFLERGSFDAFLNGRESAPRSAPQNYATKDLHAAADEIVKACTVGKSASRGRVTQPEFDEEMLRRFPGLTRDYSLRPLWKEHKPKGADRGAPKRKHAAKPANGPGKTRG